MRFMRVSLVAEASLPSGSMASWAENMPRRSLIAKPFIQSWLCRFATLGRAYESFKAPGSRFSMWYPVRMAASNSARGRHGPKHTVRRLVGRKEGLDPQLLQHDVLGRAERHNRGEGANVDTVLPRVHRDHKV